MPSPVRPNSCPIAGYQSGRKAIEYLKNSSKISLTFASLGKSAIYSPVQAKIGTQIGTVTVYATRFEKTQIDAAGPAEIVGGGVATFVGFLAIIMWAMLALFTDVSGKVPPFQLTAMTFAIGASLGLVSWLWRPGAARHLRQPAKVWLLGVVGLFGYHFLYFTALRNAPAVDASLIAYLWPLFIVVGSALMPGERLRWFHIVGTLLGLSGTVLIITKGGGVGFDPAV